VFIGGWGTDFNFLDFLNILDSNDKKQSNLYSNNQIHIQTNHENGTSLPSINPSERLPSMP
jgi:hypothetical protein